MGQHLRKYEEVLIEVITRLQWPWQSGWPGIWLSRFLAQESSHHSGSRWLWLGFNGSCCISLFESLSLIIPRVPVANRVPIWCIKELTLCTLKVALSQWSIRRGINTAVLPHLGWNESERVPPWHLPVRLTVAVVLTTHTSLAASLPHLTALVALQVLPGIRFQMRFCTRTVFKDLFTEEPS